MLLAAADVLTFTLALPAGFSPDGLAQVDIVLGGGGADDAAHNGANHCACSDAAAGDATDDGT